MNLRVIFSTLLLTVSSVAAQAASFYTYQIIDNYTYNPVPSVYGTYAVIDITFDNGNNTNINQTYTFGNIIDVNVNTIQSGGAYQEDLPLIGFITTPTYFSLGGTTVLTTDSTGSGVFSLQSAANEWPVDVFAHSANNCCFVAFSSVDTVPQIVLNLRNSSSQAAFTYNPISWSYNNGGIYATLNLNANYISPYSNTPVPAPIPAAVWLVGSSLVGLFGFNFRNAVRRNSGTQRIAPEV